MKIFAVAMLGSLVIVDVGGIGWSKAAEPEKAPTDWISISGCKMFRFTAPPGTRSPNDGAMPIDSCAASYEGPGFTLTNDYGIYSDELRDAERNNAVRVEKTLIDGKKATLVIGPGGDACAKPRKTMVGVHVVGFATGFAGEPNTLAMWACVDSDSDVQIVNRMFRSLRFY